MSTSYDAPNQLEPEVPFDPHLFLLEGVLETCPNEMIHLYLTLILNPELAEDFQVEEMRRNRQRVMIKLNKAIDYDAVSTRQKKVPEICGAQVTIHRVRVPDTLRVFELANACTKEILNLYFTNVKISHGGDIKSIKMFSYENKALVQFRHYAQVEEVLAKTHIICDCIVKLERYYEPIEDEYFLEEEEFENQGAIAAVATQQQQQQPPSLLSSKSDRFKRQSIWAMTSLRSFVTPQQTHDKTKLILSNIQENANIQQIEFLIQLITNKQEINEINWSLENKGKLLIDFKKEVDISRVLHEFNQNSLNNLNGKPVQLETVNATRTLVVLVKDSKQRRAAAKLDSPNADEEYNPESIPATRDLLELYFVNKARSGGGEIESIERKSARYWLVVMRDHRVIKEILARKHVVDEKPIRVFPYFENFGLPYLFKHFDEQATLTTAESQHSSSVLFRLKIKDDRLRYFCKVKSLHRKLNEILSESNAVSRYNKQESNVLFVTYVEKVQTKVPFIERMWRLKVKESIEYFLHIYKYEKLTLSFNQWTTICKAKQINESLLKQRQHRLNDDEEFEDTSMIDASTMLLADDKIKYVDNNCAIIGVTETETNVEMSIVGPNSEVDKFIVKIKDIICKVYFTFELEEKIIKFKTYLYECETLLAKWLSPEAAALADSEVELTLPSARSAGYSSTNDSVSITYRSLKLNRSRRNTINEFINKLERDHLDMELSYGKLFQELGYTFLANSSARVDDDENWDDEEEHKYMEFNDKLSSALDESIAVKSNDASGESQMDKIKYTLDELRARINDMRRKFRQYTIKSKKISKATSNRKRTENSRQMSLQNDDDDDDDEDDEALDDEALDDEDDSDLIKLRVYVKEQGKFVTFMVNRNCKVRELKQILAEKVKVEKEEDESVEEEPAWGMSLSFNNVEMVNNSLSVGDYGINDKATITLSFK